MRPPVPAGSGQSRRSGRVGATFVTYTGPGRYASVRSAHTSPAAVRSAAVVPWSLPFPRLQLSIRPLFPPLSSHNAWSCIGAAGRVTHGRGSVFAGSDFRPVTTRPLSPPHPARRAIPPPSGPFSRIAAYWWIKVVRAFVVHAKCSGLARPASHYHASGAHQSPAEPAPGLLLPSAS